LLKVSAFNYHLKYSLQQHVELLFKVSYLEVLYYTI